LCKHWRGNQKYLPPPAGPRFGSESCKSFLIFSGVRSQKSEEKKLSEYIIFILLEIEIAIDIEIDFFILYSSDFDSDPDFDFDGSSAYSVF